MRLHLSTQVAEPFKKSGVVVSSLAAASSENLAAIESHLGYHTELQDNIFAALNTSFLHEGALIIVPRNISVEACQYTFYSLLPRKKYQVTRVAY